MDPNAATAELSTLRAELAALEADPFTPLGDIRDTREEIADVVSNLRAWRARGGFAPRGGWPEGV